MNITSKHTNKKKLNETKSSRITLAPQVKRWFLLFALGDAFLLGALAIGILYALNLKTLRQDGGHVLLVWGPLAVWWGWRGFRQMQESLTERLAKLRFARDALVAGGVWAIWLTSLLFFQHEDFRTWRYFFLGLLGTWPLGLFLYLLACLTGVFNQGGLLFLKALRLLPRLTPPSVSFWQSLLQSPSIFFSFCWACGNWGGYAFLCFYTVWNQFQNISSFLVFVPFFVLGSFGL